MKFILKKLFTLKFLEKSLLVTLLVYSIVLGFLVGFMYISLNRLTAIKELEEYKPAIPTKVYDVKNRLISEYFEEQREIVSLDDIPSTLKQALISVEDRNFYSHKGINFQGIIRAFIVNLFAGSIKEGGSTITQQLAKLLFTSRKRSIFRKIKEVWLSLQIEKLYTKNEILSFYLNQVYFGHGAYGVESASLFYFRKHTYQLNLSESALLAGLPAAPNRFSPIKNPEESQKRHKKVLRNMVSDGIITKKEMDESFYDFWINYQGRIMAPNSSLWKIRIDNAPHFTEYIRRIVEKKFGSSTIYKEGLNIYTTLDLDMQKAAQKTLWESLEEQNKKYYARRDKLNKYFDNKYTDLISLIGLLFNNKKIDSIASRKDLNRFNYYFSKEILDESDIASLLFGIDDVHRIFRIYRGSKEDNIEHDKVEGALISIDPSNGYIKAMVGGSEFTPENQLNRAVQSYRQPGSAFKPFIYITALDTGRFTPATTFTDAPVLFIDKKGEEWIPNNYTGRYYGLVTLRKALQKSINIISVKLADAIGVDKIRELAAKLLHIYVLSEMNKRLQNDLSLALGTATVSPLEMANAFAIIANKGRDVIPISIRYITDRNGNLVIDYEKDIKAKPHFQIVTPQVAFLITDMMRSVLKPGGTAWSAVCQTGFSLPAAGKTGTTDNWRDAWFAGFTENLATVVWVGFDDYSRSLGLSQEGGTVAAPIWAQFMMKALRNKYVRDFSVPSGITNVKICLMSGKLPSPDCKEVGEEYFIKGSEPNQICTECREGYQKYELDEKKVENLLDRERQEKKDSLFKKRLKLHNKLRL